MSWYCRLPWQIAVAAAAVGLAVFAYWLQVAMIGAECSVVHVVGFARRVAERSDWQSTLPIVGLLTATALLHMTIWWREVEEPRRAVFYADRLRATLDAGASVGEAWPSDSQAIRSADDPLEVLGLKPNFTRQELQQAWRRRAAALHPDRWHGAGEDIRQAEETALASVNAARDELEPYAL